MNITFVGDTKKYGVPHGRYEIQFRNEHNTIFVSLSPIGAGEYYSLVFSNPKSFLDSIIFEGDTKPRGVRKHTDMQTTLYFTVGETAQYFGVAVNTINRWVKNGKLKVHHRIGNDRRFDREECERLYGELLEGY